LVDPGVTPAVEMRGIVKSFPGVTALRGVDLAVLAGEVHVLLGENGAGKSTLMKILSGVHPPDAGTILLDGRPCAFQRPEQALAAGIRTIYQELSLIEPLTVAENLYLARPPVGRLRHLSSARLNGLARRALEAIAPDVPPDATVARLPIGARQRVEIARALLERGRVLIMDEPTASLNAAETERLFSVVRELCARGLAILYVTHRMEEIEAIGDRVTVLRDGVSAGTLPARGTPLPRLIGMMVGDVPPPPEPPPAPQGAVLLEVRALGRRGRFSEVSFAVRAGEVVSVAGLVGSGTTELARALFGAEPADQGEIRVAGRPLRLRSPRDAIAAGIG
jgi:ribose transport system ATP-binding protein